MINYPSNFENITDLVTNHFSLDKESLVKFSQVMHKGTAADEEVLANLDRNFRYEKNLSIQDLERIDVSWKYFKFYFGEYCFDEGITYSEFLMNNKMNQKNVSKLSREVKRYYSKNDTAFQIIEKNKDYSIDMFLEIINNLRLPRKKLKMVLTFNLSDMFMCSTGQDWTSCLNLKSEYFGSYWLGLASLPFDRNRCMIYITTQRQETNTVFGIETERMYKRAFGLLDKNNQINILRWYPNGFEGSFYIKAINDFIPLFSFKEIEDDYAVKHPLELPSLKTTHRGEKIKFYIYQDKTKILNYDSLFYTGEKENQYFRNGMSENGPFVNCEGGLSRMVNNDREVIDFISHENTCANCGERISEGDTLFYNDETYCSMCYDEIYHDEEYDEEEAY